MGSSQIRPDAGAGDRLCHGSAGGSAVGWGYFAGAVADKIGWSALGLGGLGVGIVVGAVVFIFSWKDTRYYNYQFICYPWDAPTGGKDCEKCNQGTIPCTEYRCKSLGQACDLVNQGTREELCVWNNSQDVSPPVLRPWTDILTTGYRYIPDTSAPSGLGWKIVPIGNDSGCVAPFTPITFGLMSNEPAKCKLDTESKTSFEDMSQYFGGSSTTKYNHSQILDIPDPNTLEADGNVTIENGNSYTLYSRCQDVNENSNVANYIFRFCVNKGPDTTAPLIDTTSILNGHPIAFNQSSVDLSVYTNEPAECRWSKTDQEYNNMENQMSCRTGVFEMNAQYLYECTTTLTGLKSGQNNDFYFRCLDQPYLKGTENESKRNADSTSCVFVGDPSQCKFTLVGTQPLVIDQITPNSTTIKDSTDVIRVTLNVETSAGYNEGEATCYYNGTGTNNQFNEFYDTGSYQHSQDLYLTAGDYNYNIKCVDLGGNSDIKSTSFSVETDSQPPIVVRAYHDESYLNIITNENATCVYSNTAYTGCNYDFNDGLIMQSTDNTHHQVGWDTTKTFYIKCSDDFGNRPLPDQCSMIANPYSVISKS